MAISISELRDKILELNDLDDKIERLRSRMGSKTNRTDLIELSRLEDNRRMIANVELEVVRYESDYE